jgi:hypothetical protein
MVTDLFGSILEDAGKVLGIPLVADSKNRCLITFPTGTEVQIEVDSSVGSYIMIASDLGSPTPGAYRVNVFREALKSNGLPPPRNGIFAYAKKKDSLFLYAQLPLEGTSGQLLAESLTPFIQKAELWRGAIATGQTPSFRENESSVPSGGGMFGLR